MTRRLLLATDFDGTVATSGKTGRPRLNEVARRVIEEILRRDTGTLAFVSGRSLRDLKRWTADFACYRAGSYGAEIITPGGAWLRRQPRLRISLPASLRAQINASSLFLDEKPQGIALHWPSEDAACTYRPLLDAFRGWAELESLRIVYGLDLMEAVGHDEDKGLAIQLIAAAEGTPAVVYAGNDASDVPALKWACGRGHGFFVSGDHTLPPPDSRCRRAATISEVWRAIATELKIAL